MGGRNGSIVKVRNQLSANSGFSLGITQRLACKVVCVSVSVRACVCVWV